VRRGYELNYGLFAITVTRHTGILPPEHSFVQIEQDNVVLTAVKKAEDDDDIVLRFYEWAGKETDVQLHLPEGVMSASDADLMERPHAVLRIRNGTVSVPTKPYEIKTVKVHLSHIGNSHIKTLAVIRGISPGPSD
jgi:alpha-mannosidase